MTKRNRIAAYARSRGLKTEKYKAPKVGKDGGINYCGPQEYRVGVPGASTWAVIGREDIKIQGAGYTSGQRFPLTEAGLERAIAEIRIDCVQSPHLHGK